MNAASPSLEKFAFFLRYRLVMIPNSVPINQAKSCLKQHQFLVVGWYCYSSYAKKDTFLSLNNMIKLILLTNLAATLFMVGLIWLVQMVHYPLFARVGNSQFPRYEQEHTTLITLVVGPPMLVELLTAFALLGLPIKGVHPIWLVIGVGLVGVAWLTTLFFSVPQHTILANGFDADAHRMLVSTNWIRTVAWTLRGFLMLAIVWVMID